MIMFTEFFQTATGHPPYGYQQRVANDGLPGVLQAATGAGKTGVVLAWLWRRRYADPDGTPRRLVYALPQRSLVEQVAAQLRGWLDSLGLSDEVALHVVMGGAGATQRQWRIDMHRPAIVVGTVDSLVSKALNRGYGIGRAIFPIDFALVTNDAHWIVDEVQLCPESTTTLRQLAAFTRAWPTAGSFGLTCMTATIPWEVIDTVDNPRPGDDDIVRITAQDRTGELGRRLAARRVIRRLDADAGDPRAVAAAVRARHRPGTLTLVVVNTVKRARRLYEAMRGDPVPCLLHSRFRGRERESLMEQVTAAPGEQGLIVVATQVVEAGIDISAAVLVIEAASWPSVVQRAGRSNRYGEYDDAEVWWLPPADPAPYPPADVAAAVAELTALGGVAVTGEQLAARPVPVTAAEVTVLRRRDLLELFDTGPDMAGADVDISPYVRDGDDSDVQVAWAVWDSVDGRPPAQARTPQARWRCRVPLGELAVLIKRGVPVWRYEQTVGRWERVTGARRARPGEVLLVAAGDGGYDPATGFDPASTAPVPDSPPLMQAGDRPGGAEEGYGEDSAGDQPRTWMSLDQHSEQTRDHAVALLAAVSAVGLPAALREAVTRAAYLHDLGKCHPTWQDAVCGCAPQAVRAGIDAGRPWAKSDQTGMLRFADGVWFRHELVSLLLLDGPLMALLDGVDDPDLVRYLVLAHHGKLRVQVREPVDSPAVDAVPGQVDALLGLKQGETVDVPAMLGHPASTLVVDLDPFTLGGARSWTRTALGLRERYGPFLLAYLETLVRIADWRASAGAEQAR